MSPALIILVSTLSFSKFRVILEFICHRHLYFAFCMDKKCLFPLCPHCEAQVSFQHCTRSSSLLPSLAIFWYPIHKPDSTSQSLWILSSVLPIGRLSPNFSALVLKTFQSPTALCSPHVTPQLCSDSSSGLFTCRAGKELLIIYGASIWTGAKLFCVCELWGWKMYDSKDKSLFSFSAQSYFSYDWFGNIFS